MEKKPLYLHGRHENSLPTKFVEVILQLAHDSAANIVHWVGFVKRFKCAFGLEPPDSPEGVEGSGM